MADWTTIPSDAVFARHPFAHEILKRLQHAGHESFLIGGVVRDALLSQVDERITFPPPDIDLATSALPDEIRALFLDRPVLGVGEEFGVLLVVAPDGSRYQVATFRVESEYDGRWPGKVELVRDLAQDVRRRDITINGLACGLDGRVIDLVGGVEDLQSRRIRTIGRPEDRFGEDYLRMLRVVRFACHIGGQIDDTTAAAIRRLADRTARISAERVGEEILRMLQTARSADGLCMLHDLGLLTQIIPELSDCEGVPQPEAYHPEGDVLTHTVEALRVADGFIRCPVVKLAVMLHDIGKPVALKRNQGRNMGGHCAIGATMAIQIARRLRLSKAQTQHLQFLVRQHMRIADFPKMNRGKQIRFVSEMERDSARISDRFHRFFDVLRLLVADCEASAHRASGWAPVLQETLRVVDHIDRVCGMERARALIDGHDLIRLGLRQGPGFGDILTALHDRILVGQIASRDQALQAAREMIGTRASNRNGEARD